MLKEEMRRLAAEFGFLAEDVGRDIGDQIKRAEKLDNVETITFGLETDDGKIVKVFVNANDAEKFEKLMADCLGSTDSIEDAINKAAAEVDIVDVEWPDEPDEEKEEPEGSDVMDKKVYGDKETAEKTKAKKSSEVAEELTYGEKVAMNLFEDQGAVSSRMTTPNQQLILQAILDLGIPEIALDRSPYRGAIIKGMKMAAQELQNNGTAKSALKTFIKKSIDAVSKDKVKESVETVIGANGTSDEVVTGLADNKVVMSESENGLMLKSGLLMIDFNLEELERALKAIVERATTVVGKITISPRSGGVMLKLRDNPARMQLDAAQLGEFKELANKLLGE